MIKKILLITIISFILYIFVNLNINKDTLNNAKSDKLFQNTFNKLYTITVDLLDNFTTGLKITKTKIDGFREDISEKRKTVHEIKKGYDDVKQSYDNIKKVVDTTSTTIKETRKSLDGINDVFNTSSGVLQNVTDGVSNIKGAFNTGTNVLENY